MKRTACRFMVLAVVLPAAAYAGGESELQAAFKTFSFDYREDFPPPGKSEESGWLPGAALRYTFRGSSIPLYASLLCEATIARTTYDGAIEYSDGTIAPYSDKTSNTFLRVEGQVGFSLSTPGRISLTLFSGYGYRSWTRRLPGSGGYEEEYSWGYVPLGALLEFPAGARWTLAAETVARFMVNGSIAILLPQFNNPDLTLGDRFGWRIALPVGYTWNSAWSFNATPWLDYSAIGESNNSATVILGGISEYVREPSSHTRQAGLDIGITLHF